MLKELHAERVDEVQAPKSEARSEVNVAFVLRELDLHVTVRFRQSTEPTAYVVSATYNLHYRITEQRTNDEAHAFAVTNAVFNVWPFWRELVHNTAIRMGFPAPVIPLLKI